MDIKAGLARHDELKGEYFTVFTRLNAFNPAGHIDKLHKIRAEAYALQFELLLHMPCRQFFKVFNIN